MPDRILPSRRGILDGFIYVLGAYYIFHGFAWFALIHPGKLAGIPWFHTVLTDDTVGWWFVVLGSAIILGLALGRREWVRTVVLNISVLTALLPGCLFLLAWIFGYYPRGILVASSLVGVSAMAMWMVMRSAFIEIENAEEIRKIKSEEV